MKTILQREAVYEQQMVLSGGEQTNEPGNLDQMNHKKQNNRHSRPTRPYPANCVVAVVKDHMGVINVQLERRYATGVKRKDTTTHNVTPKWEQINIVLRLVLIHHS